MREPPTPSPAGDQPPSPDETLILLRRVNSGDADALDTLVSRMLPRLRRWAHGRLPRSARSMVETGDVVQVVVAKAVRHFARIDTSRAGALGLYLRTALSNEIIDQWRSAKRAPFGTSLGETLEADDTSPLERLIGLERLERYEAALSRLSESDRNAIVGRFELGYEYGQLAQYLGVPSQGAARVAVHRAVKRLGEQARHV